MFAKPRPKKSILPPPTKKRKTAPAIEEISFDFDARQEYLTGFHKRKQQRIKNAQEEAAKRARLERIEARKQVREERKRDVEEHVKTVNQMLVESGAIDPEDVDEDSQGDGSDEWDGFPDQPNLEMVDHEEEYIDEDRYTTVTVESVSVSRDGFEKPVVRGAADDEEADKGKDGEDGATDTSKTKDMRPKKKKKFRYESKLDRKLTERKQRIKKAKR